ncbi:hypothetical protein KSS94_12005 [Pseudomonas fakonensis]|uniref:Uncharacterized protein n=1 Tax=Pseudomonas fakonensis TaxID=2842355 RepID=A0ABX8ND20_9PSED|nr:hypothetical protein [Pseudomonas fakonensis]QXH54294.1 hypothetical protein KSS94_12005 [Pseudomonas fakonensis]
MFFGFWAALVSFVHGISGRNSHSYVLQAVLMAAPFQQEKPWGLYMSCLICAGQAESVECPSGFEQRCCVLCGSYRMSQALVLRMMDEGQIFDAQRMRDWLAGRRVEGEVPVIELHEAIVV